MAGNEVFKRVEERGWRRGFGNLTRGVLSDWLGGRRLVSSSLVWVGLIDVLLGLVLLQGRGVEAPAGADGVMLYGIFGGIFVSVGVVIAAQHALVGEKTSGTAAWVMSKPVSRTAFVLSKAVGNGTGLLVTAVLIPGAIAYVLISLWGGQGWLNPLWFLAGMAVLALNMVLWLCLSLMLGAYLNHPAGVIGIALAVLFGQQFVVGSVPPLGKVLPLILTAPVGDAIPSVAAQLIAGQAPATWLPVVVAALASALFLTMAVRRFEREEL